MYLVTSAGRFPKHTKYNSFFVAFSRLGSEIQHQRLLRVSPHLEETPTLTGWLFPFDSQVSNLRLSMKQKSTSVNLQGTEIKRFQHKYRRKAREAEKCPWFLLNYYTNDCLSLYIYLKGENSSREPGEMEIQTGHISDDSIYFTSFDSRSNSEKGILH